MRHTELVGRSCTIPRPEGMVSPGPDTPRADPAPSAEEVYQTYGTRVYSVAYRMTGNQADAEDVTQEVLLQVVRRLDTFRGDSQLSTWLHRVTVNAVLVLRRRRAAARERQFPDDGAEAGHAGTGRRGVPAGTPDAAALAAERRARLEAAVAALPPAYRDPFVLSDVERLSNAEVGDMLGLSVPAVKSRHHRARLMLRDALRGYE